MTNAEKFKTTEERGEALANFCRKLKCSECPAYKRSVYCRFAWLELEAEEEQMTASEAADILAEHNKWCRYEGEYAEIEAKCNITPKELRTAIDRAIEILRNIKE